MTILNSGLRETGFVSSSSVIHLEHGVYGRENTVTDDTECVETSECSAIGRVHFSENLKSANAIGLFNAAKIFFPHLGDTSDE